MKSYLFGLILIFATMSLSCEKTNPLSENIKEIILQNHETFEHDFKITGDEEGATIKRQAEHYKTSELVRDSSTNWSVVFRFKPEINFTGTDYVEIETCTGGTGVTCSNYATIKFNFIITD